jgi:hypothetical protein
MRYGAAVLFIALLGLLGQTQSGQTQLRSYQTNFPATENPISESNSWINGGTTGVFWGNVQTSGGQAHGTVISGAPPFNDSTAVLAGAWGPNQYAKATVRIANGNDPASQQEVELRTNTTITPNSTTGYEYDLNIRSSQAYVIIVRWNPGINQFSYCTNGGTCGPGGPAVVNFAIHDGDVIEANNIGGKLKLLVNGVVEFSTTDTTYSNGSPGVGFWQIGGTTANLLDFGLTNFSASDLGGNTPPQPPTNLRVTGVQ